VEDILHIEISEYLEKAQISLDEADVSETEVNQESEENENKITSEIFMQGMDSLVLNLADDLLPQVTEESEYDFMSSKDEAATPKMTISGLDFDRFRSHYRDGSLGLLKALRDLTREYKALGGILMKKDQDSIIPVHSIGINEDGVESLKENNFPMVLGDLVSQGEIIFIRNKNSASLKGCFSHPDFRIFHTWIIMPLESHEGLDFILLGYKDVSQTFLNQLL